MNIQEFEKFVTTHPRITYGKTDTPHYLSELHQYAMDSQRWMKELKQLWQALKESIREVEKK